MLETSAEVLTHLLKAFDHYEKKNDAAWRKHEWCGPGQCLPEGKSRPPVYTTLR
jgi:hypothetical protein